MKRPPRVSFVSLGCPKAVVDSERIVTRLRAGYELSRDHADADLAIVNTRGLPRQRAGGITCGHRHGLGAALDHVGCFRYEPVAGAAANDLAAPVPEPLKEERYHRLMQRPQEISRERLKRKIGRNERVIIDESGPPGAAKGRSKGDAQQIDGTVYVPTRRPLRVGEIATVKIERTDAHDLYGTAVGY